MGKRIGNDCAPTGAAYSSIGPVVSGFDAYGYPVIRNFNLPKPYVFPDEGRKYGLNMSMIRPVRFAQTGEKRKPGLAGAGGFKLKTSPTVPGAPDDLPEQFDFCVQRGEGGYFLRFRNPNTSMHGAAVEADCRPDPDTGMMICAVQAPGFQGWGPLCEEPGADKEPVSPECCVQLKGETSGQIVCPGSAYDLLIVRVLPGTEFDVKGIKHISVQHPDLPGGGQRLPVCVPIDEVPEDRPCCIEEGTGLIVCAEGFDFALAGQKLPLDFLEFVVDENGEHIARMVCGDILALPVEEIHSTPQMAAMYNICNELGGYKFKVCKKKTVPPRVRIPEPPKFPDICCFDPETSKLVCEGTKYHDLLVRLINTDEVAGKMVALVEHESIPDGRILVPFCPTPPELPEILPAECCVVETGIQLTLKCVPEDHPWHMKNVTNMGRCFDTPNGRMCAVEWEDEFGRHTIETPVCAEPPEKVPPPPPPPPQIPPADCCVMETAGGQITLLCKPEDHPWNMRNVTSDAKCFDTDTGRMCAVQFTDQFGEHMLEVPVCEEPPEKVPPPPPPPPKIPPADCCVMETAGGQITLLCKPEDHPWNMRNVTSDAKCFDTDNDRMCVVRFTDQFGEHTLEVPVCEPPPERVPPPGKRPPPPGKRPPPPGKKRPPKQPPFTPDDCGDEKADCLRKWNEMVKCPAKESHCDAKWAEVVKQLKKGGCGPMPGRRYSAMGFGARFGTGIPDESKQYARFPGMRGGRRVI